MNIFPFNQICSHTLYVRPRLIYVVRLIVCAACSLDKYRGKLEHEQLKELAQAGKELFSARFTVADGVGRPLATQAIIPTKRKRPPRNEFARTAGLDANACVSCHNQPVAPARRAKRSK